MAIRDLKSIYNIVGEIIHSPVHKDNFNDHKGEKFLPIVKIIPDNSINAFAERIKNRIEIGIHQGAMDILDERTMKALLAHEISHVSNNDLQIDKKIYLLPTTALVLVSFALFFIHSYLGWIGIGLSFVVGTLTYAKLIQTREELADLHGAVISGKGNMIELLKLISYDRPYTPFERFVSMFHEHPHWQDRINYIERKLPDRKGSQILERDYA